MKTLEQIFPNVFAKTKNLAFYCFYLFSVYSIALVLYGEILQSVSYFPKDHHRIAKKSADTVHLRTSSTQCACKPQSDDG